MKFRKFKNTKARKLFLLTSFLVATFSTSFNTGDSLQKQALFEKGPVFVGYGDERFSNAFVKPLVTPTDTHYGTQLTYSLSNVGDIESVWDYYQGEDTLIAVIDSGFTYEHEDFIDENGESVFSNASRYYEYVSSINKVQATNAYNNWSVLDHDYIGEDYGWDSHGSNVAGTAAASLNTFGTVGIAPKAKILAIKVDMNFNSLYHAIKYAADQGADVINMSLGAYDANDPHTADDSFPGVASFLSSSINYARESGSIVVAAAGNENTSAKSYPACNSGVIGVGALNRNSNKDRAWFSNINKSSDSNNTNHNVDIMAPGYVYAPGLAEDELDNDSSNYPSFGYARTQGTSFASPIVAGAAALWKEKYPNGTPDEFEQALYDSAVDLDNYTKFGNGRLDIYNLLDIGEESLTLSSEDVELFIGDDPYLVTATSQNSAITNVESTDESVFTVSVEGLNTGNANINVQIENEGIAELIVNDALGNEKSIIILVSLPPVNDEDLLVSNSPYINGIPYNMYFLNEESEKTHYFNGELEGTNGSTTLFHEEGKNVYFEKNGDGQNIYFLKDGVKNYLYVDRVGASVNFAYSPTLPGISWMYDGVNGCISYLLDGVNYTFSASSSLDVFAATSIEEISTYKVNFVSNHNFAVNAYARVFLYYLDCDATGASEPTFKDNKSWAILKEVYENLSEEAKNSFVNSGANPSGNKVEQTLARYEYIVSKYGTAKFDNFMKREGIVFLLNPNVLTLRKNVYILLISLTSLGLILISSLIIKQKKNRKFN